MSVKTERHIDTLDVFVDDLYVGYVWRASPCGDCSGDQYAVRFDGRNLGHNRTEDDAIRRLAPSYQPEESTR